MAGLGGSEIIGIVIVVAVLAIALIVACFRCARLVLEEMQKAPPGERSFKRAFRSSVRRTAREGVQHVNTIRRSFRRSKPQTKSEEDAPPSYNEVLSSSTASRPANDAPVKNADLIAPAGRRIPEGQRQSNSQLPTRGAQNNKPRQPATSTRNDYRPHQGGVHKKTYGQSPESDSSRNLELSDLGVGQPPRHNIFPDTHNSHSSNTSQYNYANMSNLTTARNEYEPLRSPGVRHYERYRMPNDRHLQHTDNIDPRSPGFIRTPGAADPRSPADIPRTPAFRYEEGESGFRPYIPPNRHLPDGNAEGFNSQMSPKANIPTVSYHPSSHVVGSNQYNHEKVSFESFNHQNQPDTYI
ncbi:unnamed protein product [Dimorphilus gyrociliatus]|uniref:Uncharacterized protein n=1 Tax=Dimorphilus gyrociliatus TaxID=2664684 RepID=A0A7I8VCP3_9ANNE|nr:unnamed protein product [Dimorphilus gyrociliatus]